MKKFKFKINGSDYEVSVNEIEKNIAEIEVNGTPFTVEIEKQEKATAPRKEPGKVNPIATPLRVLAATSIKAPLPGSIIKVLVSEGQAVKRGDVVMIMESMKMENNILAENDYIVKKIHVQAGQSVMQDDVLIDLEGGAASASVKEEVVKAPVASAPAPQAVVKSAGIKTIKSPLPGSVINVLVQVGQSVKRGDLLLTLESMKMENNILSEKDGIVKNIHVKAGQSVMQDDSLIDIE